MKRFLSAILIIVLLFIICSCDEDAYAKRAEYNKSYDEANVSETIYIKNNETYIPVRIMENATGFDYSAWEIKIINGIHTSVENEVNEFVDTHEVGKIEFISNSNMSPAFLICIIYYKGETK